MSIELPHKFRDAVNAMPEHSYGVARVIVTLADGREIPDVHVGWGIDVLKVGGSRENDFRAEDIVSVRHYP
jgi:hypothetical protein